MTGIRQMFVAAIALTNLYCLRGFQLQLTNVHNTHNKHIRMSLLKEIKSSDELLKGTTLEKQQLIPIFIASKDGWDSSTFHQKVDFNPSIPVIIICKTKSGICYSICFQYTLCQRAGFEYNNRCNLWRL